MLRPAAVALTLVAASTLTGAAGAAPSKVRPHENHRAAGPDERARPELLRLALSPAAASFMTELRVRALLEVELDGSIPIAEGPVGPLDERAVRVFVDQPEGASILIQVQTPGRPLTRRHVDVTGLTWDVAARFAAIATAEIIRAHLAPARVRRARPRGPTQAQLEAADQARLRMLVSGSLRGDIGAGPVLMGPELAIGHATRVVDVRFSGAMLGGDQASAAELGATAVHRVHAAAWLRAELGAGIGVGTAAVTEDGEHDREGYGRLTARAGLVARVAPETWLGLRIDPGMVVGGPSLTQAAGGTDRPFEGASVGLALSLTGDVPIEPRRAAAR